MSKTKPLNVAGFLSAHIALSGKTQVDIARECGFEKPNVLTMLKQGKMKIPLGRAAAIARAVGIEPYELISRLMEEYVPETWQAILDHFSVTPAKAPSRGAEAI
jgi:DNA-binding transcriptional regulator YdaS (Cro superfamily)